MIQAARRTKVRIGPENHGQRMSLDDFDHAIAREGHVYELAKGVIEVSEVPKPEHAKQVQELRNQLSRFQQDHPEAIDLIAGSNECKLLIGAEQSERHPDLSLYLRAEPDTRDVWSVWIPEIVIEIVSESSRKRDYNEKPDEYLELGIKEYWIVDAGKGQMTVMERWRGQWKPAVIKPTRKYSTSLLPGFSMDLKRVLDAAKKSSSRK